MMMLSLPAELPPPAHPRSLFFHGMDDDDDKGACFNYVAHASTRAIKGRSRSMDAGSALRIPRHPLITARSFPPAVTEGGALSAGHADPRATFRAARSRSCDHSSSHLRPRARRRSQRVLAEVEPGDSGGEASGEEEEEEEGGGGLSACATRRTPEEADGGGGGGGRRFSQALQRTLHFLRRAVRVDPGTVASMVDPPPATSDTESADSDTATPRPAPSSPASGAVPNEEEEAALRGPSPSSDVSSDRRTLVVEVEGLAQECAHEDVGCDLVEETGSIAVLPSTTPSAPASPAPHACELLNASATVAHVVAHSPEVPTETRAPRRVLFSPAIAAYRPFFHTDPVFASDPRHRYAKMVLCNFAVRAAPLTVSLPYRPPRRSSGGQCGNGRAARSRVTRRLATPPSMGRATMKKIDCLMNGSPPTPFAPTTATGPSPHHRITSWGEGDWCPTPLHRPPPSFSSRHL